MTSERLKEAARCRAAYAAFAERQSIELQRKTQNHQIRQTREGRVARCECCWTCR